MKKYAFGIDIGGTTVKIGLFSTEETLIKKWEIPTRKDNGGSYILSDISESIAEELKNQGIEKEDVEGIGIDVPGPVLEDRIVKTIFRRNENPCICPPNFPACVCGNVSKGRVVTRKPILPSEKELTENSRSQSAKLRVFERHVKK